MLFSAWTRGGAQRCMADMCAAMSSGNTLFVGVGSAGHAPSRPVLVQRVERGVVVEEEAVPGGGDGSGGEAAAGVREPRRPPPASGSGTVALPPMP